MSKEIECRGLGLSATVDTAWKEVRVFVRYHEYDNWDKIESQHSLNGPPEFMFQIAEAILEIKAAEEECKFRENVAAEVIDGPAAKEATAQLIADRALGEAIGKAIATAKGETE